MTELVHVPLVHSADKLREVYNEVCRTCGYENFTRVQGGGRIERADTDGTGRSQLVLLSDRIQLSEDHTGITVDQFGKKAVGVLSTALPTLGIPFLLLQVCTVRVTAAPNHFRNAAEYLARSLFRIGPEDVERLDRPATVFGFRLVFPPAPKHPNNYSVRVECYARDVRSLYIENVGSFNAPIQPGNIAEAERNLQTTSDFLVEKVVGFLSRFDRKDEA